MERKLCSKTREEVALEYGVSRKTFRKWLKKANIHPSPGRLLPATLNQIYDHFGEPLRESRKQAALKERTES
ncbi:MAG: hypothetical protein Sapg2KO_32380 [Saprospiraceae bacterium]